jgi:fatty acid synthase subunit alpha, fungi type
MRSSVSPARVRQGDELPLEELGWFSGALGKYSTGLVSRLIGGKMPGVFNSSAIKSYLSKNLGLGSSRSDRVLLLGTTLEPPDQQKFAAQHVELYMRYFGRDSRAGEAAFDQENATNLALQAKLDSINREHGDTYIEGIQPRSDILKARHFDSSWNWFRQDALLMYYDSIFGRLTTVDREITARCIALLNRADPDMLQFMQYNINHCDASKGETYRLAKEFGQKLIDNTREVVGKPPVCKDGAFPQCIVLQMFITDLFLV